MWHFQLAGCAAKYMVWSCRKAWEANLSMVWLLHFSRAQYKVLSDRQNCLQHSMSSRMDKLHLSNPSVGVLLMWIVIETCGGDVEYYWRQVTNLATPCDMTWADCTRFAIVLTRTHTFEAYKMYIWEDREWHPENKIPSLQSIGWLFQSGIAARECPFQCLLLWGLPEWHTLTLFYWMTVSIRYWHMTQ